MLTGRGGCLSHTCSMEAGWEMRVGQRNIGPGPDQSGVRIAMDASAQAAAAALAVGDPLGALKRIALRDDAAALALRGIAMAQLGEFVRAKALFRAAANAFGTDEPVPHARCVVAEAEVALASRDLGWPERSLADARVTLEAHGDQANATYARLLELRRWLLIGRIEEAERALRELDPAGLGPASKAIYELIIAGMALRDYQARTARQALARAAHAAKRSGIAALDAELQRASAILDMPAARLISAAGERLVLLDDVQRILASGSVVVDGCRHVVCQAGNCVSLAKRPMLFALVRALAEAWPDDVSRHTLIAQAFRTRTADESHRARLRVEMGRLRALLGTLVSVTATRRGFRLAPFDASDVLVLARPVEGRHAALLACLADGHCWSSSGLALALGISQRSVQRALDELASTGKVESIGSGRSRRWMAPPMPGFATILLLPGATLM